MFSLQAESHNKVTVLRLAGDMVLPDVPDLSRQLDAYILAPGIRQVVLDLSEVNKLDASGLGVLVSASTKGRSQGRRLVLLTPAPHVTDLLRKFEIEGFFPTFYSEEELKGYIPDTAE